MATMIKTNPKKTTRKSTNKKPDYPPLPPSSKVVDIGGREYAIVPIDEYDDWLQDALLGVITEDRIKNGRDAAAPLAEVEARLFPGKKVR